MSESEIVSVTTGVSNTECQLPSVDNNRAVRNVQTQHGDYRTVDEENIVVLPLARCHSPEPTVDETGEVESVIIEPFAEENQVHDPPHTSSLMFELYESKEGHYIQLFYRNTNAKHLVPLSIPNCGTKCSLRKYYELYGEFLASDPEKECVAHANHAESGGRMIESSFVFSIFNIVLIYTWIYH